MMASMSPGALILHWNLDDASGTTAADSSGNGHSGGYLTGTPSWSAAGGASGGYVSFAGADNDHAFRTTSFPKIATEAFTPFTISLWLRSADTTNNTAAVLRTGVGNSYYSVKTQSNTVRQVARNTTEIQNSGGAISGGTIDPAAWHHVVAVYSSPTAREIFVNGSSVSTNTTDVPFLVPTGFTIGALDRSDVSVVDEFAGDLDDVQLYDHALSAADVTFLFNNAGSTVSVPEPSTGLLACFALGLGLARRCRVS